MDSDKGLRNPAAFQLLADHAATCQKVNGKKWMEELATHLNAAFNTDAFLFNGTGIQKRQPYADMLRENLRKIGMADHDLEEAIGAVEKFGEEVLQIVQERHRIDPDTNDCIDCRHSLAILCAMTSVHHTGTCSKRPVEPDEE